MVALPKPTIKYLRKTGASSLLDMENVRWHMGVKTLKEVQDRKPAVWFTQCWTMKLGQTCKTVEFYRPLKTKFMRSHWLGCKPKSLGVLACFQQGSTTVQQALVLPCLAVHSFEPLSALHCLWCLRAQVEESVFDSVHLLGHHYRQIGAWCLHKPLYIWRKKEKGIRNDGRMNTLTFISTTFEPCYFTFPFGCPVQVQGPVCF